MQVLALDNLAQHDSIYLGLSGGLDSMVLLDYLSKQASLAPKLKVIHVHHGISQHADTWLTFCQEQCQKRSIPCYTHHLEFNQAANLEARARAGRYQVFLAQTKQGDAIVLAHHLDDQIETFFLNAIRGTGLSGLAAMPQARDFVGRTLYRPLLHTSRSDLAEYAKMHHLDWIEDDSNLDTSYSRNFLRHEILPRIASHWPHYRASITHTIEDCQHQLQAQQQQFGENLVEGRVIAKSALAGLSQSEVYSYLRLWCKTQNFALPSRAVLDEIWQQFFLASRPDANPWVRWGQVGLRSYAHHLYLDPIEEPTILKPLVWQNFPKPLGSWQAKPSQDDGVHIHPQQDRVEIRYRQGGEKIRYRGHHRCLKKLLQGMKIPPWQRSSLALLYVNHELQAVLGYFYADQKPLQPGQDCYQMVDMNRSMLGVHDVDCRYSRHNQAD